MTYIEFFTQEAVENTCACLTTVPDKVILIGESSKLLEKHLDKYRKLFKARGHSVEFVPKSVTKYDLNEIVDALTEIIENNEDCAFGLTGGEELYLVAMGIVFERFKDRKIQMHRFNIRKNVIYDCDQDGITIQEENVPALSVEENICIYGGGIIQDYTQSSEEPEWNWEGDLQEDIQKMWEICRKKPQNWNGQMGVFAFAEKLVNNPPESLHLEASVPQIKACLEAANARYVYHPYIMSGLLKCGLLTSYSCDDYTFSVTYKNEQVKRCLTKAGQILELLIYMTALFLQEEDGSYTYNDVMTGVRIDWDGVIHTDGETQDTANEIDVILMHNMVPVFISCKNGRIDVEELYKLNTVASRFGGKYVKKVLIATSLDPASPFTAYLKQRAEDMNIRVEDKILDMNMNDLQKMIRELWWRNAKD